MTILPAINLQTTPSFNNLTTYQGIQGKILHFFGLTLKIWDPKQQQNLYVSKRTLAKILISDKKDLSVTQINRLATKILEVINPYTAKNTNASDLKKCIEDVSTGTIETVLTKLDEIKDQLSPFNKFSYKTHVVEIGDRLKPGDVIVRKYHEDNPNPICDLQKFFYRGNYREAYKHSHVALYLGKRPDGKHWIAEASLPHGNDPQIRRLRLDDERFELKDKNQYLVFRGDNEETAQEAARLAALYTIKLLPTKEVSLGNQKVGGFKYSRLEAFRSLLHFKNFGFFAKQRIFKYYSDYANQIPFIYITDKRNMFCSEFALLSIQMSEVRKNQVFQEIIEKHPPPKCDKKAASGVTGFFAKISYVMRRAMWCRFMAIKYAKTMEEVVKTKVDFLRTSPGDTVDYLLSNTHYKVAGIIKK